MNDTYHELANRAIEILKESNNYRVIIVLIGAPGSGKSTVLKEVCAIINSKLHDLPVINDDNAAKNVINEVHQYISNLPGERLVEDLEDENFKTYKRQISEDFIELSGKGGEDTKITLKTPAANEKTQFATVVPMDGFHLTRSQLASFKDPQYAIFRRGSPFTFDNVNLINMTRLLKMTMDYKLPRQDINFVSHSLPTLQIPGFSHHLKDPVPNEITIPSSSRILIMEGLYFLLQDDNWSPISEILQHDPISDHDLFINDLKGEVVKVPILNKSGIEFWKIHIDEQTNLTRVAKRHLQSGIVEDLHKGEERFRLNDLINGDLLMRNSVRCDLNIYSIEEDDHL